MSTLPRSPLRSWSTLPAGAGAAALFAATLAALPAAVAQTSNPRGPDVRVVNTAAQPVPVSLGGPVVISTAAPLPVSVVGASAPQPFQFSYHSANPATNQGFTVPAGKRLVIEHISCSGSDTSDSLLAVQINTRVGLETTPHLCPFTVRADMGRKVYAGAGPTRLYADGGTVVSFEILGFGASPSKLAFAGVSGYLVDAP